MGSSSEQNLPSRSQRRIGYRNLTGHPEGIPRAFIRLAIEFTDRFYGTWWYVYHDGKEGRIEGWFIWLESINLLGVSRGERIYWHRTADLDDGLTYVANELRRES
jgi:hypothetical protein